MANKQKSFKFSLRTKIPEQDAKLREEKCTMSLLQKPGDMFAS